MIAASLVMKWISLLIIAVIIAVIFMLKKNGRVSPAEAQVYLRNGALVIDVRSHGEFSAGHLPCAINIPLDELETALPRHVNDTNRVLLLHCQSGLRSGMAVRKLHGLGYRNVYNLGSLDRAREIVGNGGPS